MSLNYNSFYPNDPYQQLEDQYHDIHADGRIFPGQGGGYPGGGFPGQGGGVPGGGFPGQGGGAPTSPPPAFIPQETQATTFAVDPGGIRRCLYRFTYVWLVNGRSFWFYPIFVGRNSVMGYRWRRRYGWVYFGIDLRMIRSFQCF